jgi:hypothetical protein
VWQSGAEVAREVTETRGRVRDVSDEYLMAGESVLTSEEVKHQRRVAFTIAVRACLDMLEKEGE